MRERINYLRILSLYQLGKKEEVKRLMEALSEDTDGRYLGFYDKLIIN